MANISHVTLVAGGQLDVVVGQQRNIRPTTGHLMNL
jgi:hypothetical protein